MGVAVGVAVAMGGAWAGQQVQVQRFASVLSESSNRIFLVPEVSIHFLGNQPLPRSHEQSWTLASSEATDSDPGRLARGLFSSCREGLCNGTPGVPRPVPRQRGNKRHQQNGRTRAFYGVPRLLITASPAAAEAREDPSTHWRVSGRRGGTHAHRGYPAIHSNKDVRIKPILPMEKQRLKRRVT